MSARVIVLSVVAVLVVGAGLGAATSAPVRRLLADPAGGTAVRGVDAITVRGDPELNHAFDPAVVEVPAGTTVTWTFADTGPEGDEEPVPHNVVGDGFASQVLSIGTFAHTFEQPGSYPYACTLHAGMRGRVEVVEG